MKRIRIGNNLAITWILFEEDGNIHNLEGRELELYMTCGGFKYPVTDYTVTENAIAWTFPAKMQTKTGYYKLVLLENDSTLGLHSFDVKEAFCLEPEDALTNIGTIIDEDCSINVRSVLTYAHITNLASIDVVDGEDGKTVVVHLTNGKSFTIPAGSWGGGSGSGSGNSMLLYTNTDEWPASEGSYWYFNASDLSGTPKTGDVVLFFTDYGSLYAYRLTVRDNGDIVAHYPEDLLLDDYQLIDVSASLDVIDNLTSTSTTKPLSANMGRELKRLIDSIEPGGGSSVEIVDNLTDGGRTKALSAEQGKYLKSLIDAIDNPSSDASDVVQVMYSSVASNPGTPATDAGNWHSAQQAGDVWMALRFNDSGTWGDWSVIYLGEIDAPYASFKSSVFTRSNESSVEAPTGGSYASPVPTTSGWTDGIPSGTGAIWMSTRTFASDDTHSDAAWSTPRIIADNEFMDYEFSSVASPGTPSMASPTSANTNPNWSNTANEDTIWMAMREVQNGAYKTGSSWMVVKVKGENGRDGTSVTIKGTLSSAADLPSTGNTAGDGYLINGHLWVWDGDSWEDVGQIKGDPGADGQTPFIHIKYSNDGGLTFTENDGETPGDFIGLYWDYNAQDSSSVSAYTWKAWKGEDGFGYEYIFKLTADNTAPTLPSSSPNTDDYVPTADGWTDDPGGVTASLPFCWVAWRKKEDGVWSAWHGTTNGKARLYAHYGTDGEDGVPGVIVFKSVVFARSATQPAQPGNSTAKIRYYRMSGGQKIYYGDGVIPPVSALSELNPDYGGTFSDPIPYGWSDGVPAAATLTDPDDLSNTLWMTTRIFTEDGLAPQEADWTTPRQASDTDGFDFEFAYQQTNDATPPSPTTANRHGGSGTQIWFDPVLDSSEDFTAMYWMAFRQKVNGEGVGPWTVLRIKGEAGVGVDGKDAKPIRIRNWSEVYGQALTGDNKVFSGFEDGAPFRDVIVITKSDYPSGTTFPFDSQNSNNVVVLLTPNTPANSTGLSGTQLVLPVTGNYTPNVASNATESATQYASNIYWGVFQNLGAVYAQILVATQAYIGSLTVDHLTTSIGTNSSIYMQGGLITVKDANGVTRMQIGQGTNDTTPVLKFFDANGDLLYDLGPNGIQWASDGAVYADAAFGERIALAKIANIGGSVDAIWAAEVIANTRDMYPFTLATRTQGGNVMYYNCNELIGEGEQGHGWQPASTVVNPTLNLTVGDYNGVLTRTDRPFVVRPTGCNAELDVWPKIPGDILGEIADGWYMVNTEGFDVNSSFPYQED